MVLIFKFIKNLHYVYNQPMLKWKAPQWNYKEDKFSKQFLYRSLIFLGSGGIHGIKQYLFETELSTCSFGVLPRKALAEKQCQIGPNMLIDDLCSDLNMTNTSCHTVMLLFELKVTILTKCMGKQIESVLTFRWSPTQSLTAPLLGVHNCYDDSSFLPFTSLVSPFRNINRDHHLN